MPNHNIHVPTCATISYPYNLYIAKYLVLKIFRLLLFVVAPVNTPKEVMEVILVEFLTVGLIHRFQDFTNGGLGHKLMQL